ncbi:hypothetical protein AVEN_74394-1 [Araneus ventricosus]|uniref:Secreted protein n=1 Tax=Araneus ventricosus TaxID=182803 RepID=A0A4Y2HFM6_ARAVE|nr:hypothetical protein AVEN_74394-1 [Araneus ventricosus]
MALLIFGKLTACHLLLVLLLHRPPVLIAKNFEAAFQGKTPSSRGITTQGEGKIHKGKSITKKSTHQKTDVPDILTMFVQIWVFKHAMKYF